LPFRQPVRIGKRRVKSLTGSYRMLLSAPAALQYHTSSESCPWPHRPRTRIGRAFPRGRGARSGNARQLVAGPAGLYDRYGRACFAMALALTGHRSAHRKRPGRWVQLNCPIG
jgi:hypothetical protein